MRDRSGFTALEMLIAVAIVGILLTVGFVRLSPPSSRLLSNDLKALIHQARYEAVKRNRPVAFVWQPDRNVFEVRVNNVSALVTAACTGTSVLGRKAVADYPNTTVTVGIPTNGFVWLPTGQGRACNGSPMVSSDVQVDDGRSTLRVEITMGGKVTIQ